MIEAFLIGIIQGLTEFIPISSSAHVYLLPKIFGFSSPSTDFIIATHLGTLLALIIYFRKKLRTYFLSLLKQVLKRKIKFRDRENINILNLVFVATIPTLVLGFLLNFFVEDLYDEVLKDNKISLLVVAVPMLLVGLFFLFEKSLFKKNKKSIQDIRLLGALLIGFSQSIAFIRGVSRSGITLLSGQFVGMNRVSAAEFSFLVSIPVIFASILFSIINIITANKDFDLGIWLIGIISSFVAGYVAIDFLIKFLRHKSLKVFGIYRIIAGLILILLYFIQ